MRRRRRCRDDRGMAMVTGLVLLFAFTAGGLVWLARDANRSVSNRTAAQSIAFEAGIAEAFRAAGRFLDSRQPEVTAAMRAAGLELRLFVEVRMDQDQMELEFPPELLAACGRHGLGVYVISNDF